MSENSDAVAPVESPAQVTETVSVGSVLPKTFLLQFPKALGIEPLVINGTDHPSAKEHGVGVTPNVNREHFDAWRTSHSMTPYVTGGKIYILPA